ncbi:N-acetyltransferase family protein [Kitasatospora sp. NPDC001159]
MTSIRIASMGDITALAALTALGHQVHADHRPDLFVGGPSREALEALLSDQLMEPHVTFLIAEASDGRALGYAMAEIVERHGSALTVADSVVSLRRIAVDSGASRSGVGSALLDGVREIGRAAGCRRLVTQVWDFNEGALAFYRASGLRPTTRSLDQEI